MDSITAKAFGILEMKKLLISMMEKPREEKEPLVQGILSGIIVIRKELEILMKV